MSRNRAQRRKEAAGKAGEASAADPAAPPAIDDANTVYRPEITGRDTVQLVQFFDALVRGGGVTVASVAVPLLQKLTAPRDAAIKKAMDAKK